MTKRRIREAVDRSLEGLRFDASLKERVRSELAGARAASPPARRLTRRAAAVLAVLAALALTALAAGPAVWQAVQAHLGARAPYAAQVLAECTDQGLRLRAVAALADRNMVKVYLTLTDLEGDRLGDAFECDLNGIRWDDGGQAVGELSDLPLSGGGDEVISYDPETKTLTLCEAFYGRRSLEPLPISMRWFTPGVRSAKLRLTGVDSEMLMEAVPNHILESTVDENGNTVLLPNQNPMEMEETEGDWDVRVSSLGFAADGRLHVRLDAPGYGAPGDSTYVLLEHHQFEKDMDARVSAMARTQVLVEGGVDLSFDAEEVRPEDIPEAQMLLISASHSTLGGTIQGNWALTVPLEPVESLRLDWTGGPLWDDIWKDNLYVDEIWLSPLGITVNYHNGGNGIWNTDAPVVTLFDGTQLTPAFVNRNWVGGQGDHLWEFQSPVDLNQVASVSLAGRTLPVGEADAARPAG